MKTFDEKKEAINAIAESLRGILSDYAIKDVLKYLKYNELKLSGEMLCDHILDDEVAVPVKVFDEIKLMCIDLDIRQLYWQKMKIKEESA